MRSGAHRSHQQCCCHSAFYNNAASFCIGALMWCQPASLWSVWKRPLLLELSYLTGHLFRFIILISFHWSLSVLCSKTAALNADFATPPVQTTFVGIKIMRLFLFFAFCFYCCSIIKTNFSFTCIFLHQWCNGFYLRLFNMFPVRQRPVCVAIEFWFILCSTPEFCSRPFWALLSNITVCVCDFLWWKL